MGKYTPLSHWLKNQLADRVQLSFDEIEDEDIIGAELPRSAKEHREWWANETDPKSRHCQCRAWIIEGWIVESVDLEKEIVVFRRIHKPAAS